MKHMFFGFTLLFTACSASQVHSKSERVPSSTSQRIECLQNKGPGNNFDFYTPAERLDFTSLILSTQEPIDKPLQGSSKRTIRSEWTIDIEETRDGQRSLYQPSFSGSSIDFEPGGEDGMMARFPMDNKLRLNLFLKSIHTSRGDFDLYGSLVRPDTEYGETPGYDMVIICRFLH